GSATVYDRNAVQSSSPRPAAAPPARSHSPGRTQRLTRPASRGRCAPGPQATGVEEGLLGNMVEVTIGDLAECLHGLVQRDRGSLHTGELLGEVGVLRQELFDPAGPVDGDLVLFGKLVDTQDGDDVLQLLVLLQDRLD